MHAIARTGRSPATQGKEQIDEEGLYLSFQMAGQIDMNMQSDLMAAFEESL